MNFKSIFFGLFVFFFLSTTVSAQQATKADVQALEVRVSNLETTVKEMDKRLTAQFQAVHIRIEELDKRLTAQIQAVNARIDELDRHIGTLINILIGVVLAAIALPQVLGYLQGRRERKELQKQIQNLGERIEH